MLRGPFVTREESPIVSETFLRQFADLYHSSGDMLNPSKKYNLEYYLGVVDKIVAMGAHILGLKV